jgi:NADP-dependent 3-hydroxy acid dehydrogenase YdfG
MNHMKKLINKVAVISGGSSGIGLATARLLISEGASVAIIGRDAQKLDNVAKTLGKKALVISADVSSLQDIDLALEKVKTVYGKIDILFANAGISECPPVLETEEAFFDYGGVTPQKVGIVRELY